jgi:hypothetical protein
LCDGICVDLRYLRFIRVMVRWLNHAMSFAMVVAIIAVFAVKLRWALCVSKPDRQWAAKN